MKKCPYCAEEIQDEAIFCRYCKNNIQGIEIKNGKLIKKCPFCAEKIASSIDICTFCGRDTTLRPDQSSSEVNETSKKRVLKNNPSFGINLLCTIGVILALAALAYMLDWCVSVDCSDITFAVGFIFLSIFVLTIPIFALIGLIAKEKSILFYGGVFLGLGILMTIPVVGLIVFYWAGKGIAKFFI